MRIFSMSHALQSLRPGAAWSMIDEDYSQITWQSTDKTLPSLEECEAEIARLQAEYDALEYQRLRAPEYPPMADYLDGVVKGDQAQIDAYIAACQAVKEKYPKPE